MKTPVNLDRQRFLIYRPGDLADAERILNNESMEVSIVQRGMHRLLVYLWAGLRADDPKIPMTDVPKMLQAAMQRDDKTYPDYWSLVIEALINSGVIRRAGTEDGTGVPADPTQP